MSKSCLYVRPKLCTADDTTIPVKSTSPERYTRELRCGMSDELIISSLLRLARYDRGLPYLDRAAGPSDK
jgi:hypothetical protein